MELVTIKEYGEGSAVEVDVRPLETEQFAPPQARAERELEQHPPSVERGRFQEFAGFAGGEGFEQLRPGLTEPDGGGDVAGQVAFAHRVRQGRGQDRAQVGDRAVGDLLVTAAPDRAAAGSPLPTRVVRVAFGVPALNAALALTADPVEPGPYVLDGELGDEFVAEAGHDERVHVAAVCGQRGGAQTVPRHRLQPRADVLGNGGAPYCDALRGLGKGGVELGLGLVTGRPVDPDASGAAVGVEDEPGPFPAAVLAQVDGARGVSTFRIIE